MRWLTSACYLHQDQLLTEDEVIAALPPWTSQITVRALCVGGILGAVFSFITMRFSLGPGGVVPTFNMPIGAPGRPASAVQHLAHHWLVALVLYMPWLHHCCCVATRASS